MRWVFTCISFLFFAKGIAFSQQLNLDFQLVDATQNTPVADAHLFISDASLGSISDINGRCRLDLSEEENQVLIITHVSYETLVIPPEKYRTLINGVSLPIESNGIDIGEIQVIAKRSRKWKQNLRKFKRAFLGTGEPASKCKIMNPEVLRFKEENGGLQVTAVDLLQIDNKYLGYQINFWLDVLQIEANGSSIYKGHGQYIDTANGDEKKYKKIRDRIYRNSLPHFLKTLAENPDKRTLKTQGYQVSIDKYALGNFQTIHVPEPIELVLKDNTKGRYQLHFPEFLTVEHVKLKSASDQGQSVSVSGAEQQKFGSNRTQSIGSAKAEVSRLFKIEPYLIFDNRGNILNKSAVKEYGYWANQRIASTLPVDYQDADQNIELHSDLPTTDTLQVLVDLISNNQQKQEDALTFLKSNWSKGYISPLLDILRIYSDPLLVQEVRSLLETNEPKIEADYFQGSQQLWKSAPIFADYYADFKAILYKSIDPKFFRYFNQRTHLSNIRMDEIVWGGVRQDGIPPLRSPKMLEASEAKYLSDSDVVFSLVINGEARAYPKRILAWHEFFTDEIAGKSIAGVYCTLCGTVIIYDSEFNGVKHDLGTSGFLYRSNKLMYDKASQSLWSTMLGQPVVGPLVNQGIDLSIIPVETTTWGEWKQNHPETKVLSLETGHTRNYNEGEAYKEYYSSDALMFPVPLIDQRLPNKARVFVPRPLNYDRDPFSISISYLKRKKFHQDKIDDQEILILAEPNGRSRAYAINNIQFKSYKKGILKDEHGQEWIISEDQIMGPKRIKFERLPSHESFWFAWINAFPQSRLVH